MEPRYNGGRFSKAQLDAYIVQGLRKLWLGWAVRRDVLDAACVGQKRNSATGRMAKHYTCAHCGKDFPGKDVNVDHVIPVVDPKKGKTTWDNYLARLLVEEKKGRKRLLQVLCKGCHDVKTAAENKIRRAS